MNTMNHMDIPKRKFRWTFEGKNKAGEVVLPQCFVKPSDRPPPCPNMAVADENGGSIVPVPGEINITYFFTMYESAGEARKEYQKYNGRFSEVTSGHLQLLDGCGALVEEWFFEDVSMILGGSSELYSEDHIVPEWNVTYQKAKWVNHSGYKLRKNER